jgi:dCMP deaminase
MTDRPSLAIYALEVADVVATRAACTRRQVGAVVLDPNGRIAGTGYNGTPAGAPHCTDGGCPRGKFTHDQIPGGLGNTGHDVACIARHAEDNATSWALKWGAPIDPAASLVAITCAPCPECAALLTDQGWGTVIWSAADGTLESLSDGTLERWLRP